VAAATNVTVEPDTLKSVVVLCPIPFLSKFKNVIGVWANVQVVVHVTVSAKYVPVVDGAENAPIPFKKCVGSSSPGRYALAAVPDNWKTTLIPFVGAEGDDPKLAIEVVTPLT